MNVDLGQQTLDASTVLVKDVLKQPGLSIPHYQRPYKWQQRHVSQLIEDIQHFQNKSAYRLGSLVLHQNDKSLDIVDGQQRTITLTLLLLAYQKKNMQPENLKLKHYLNDLRESHFNPQLKHPLSQRNAKENYRFIEQRINNLSEETMLFLLEKCEFVKFTLHDLSRAFQFFDSQNARGKDLEPHDLLKAFHLRAFSTQDEAVKEEVIQDWENTDTKKLSGLFQYYLYRIKEWGNRTSARFFTKANVDLFKGIDLNSTQDLPFTQILRLADVYTRMYNASLQREVDQQLMKFPFQLEMPVLNGKMFFEMINHYLEKTEQLMDNTKRHLEEESVGRKVIDCIANYSGRNRDGDRYIRQLFKATLLQYIDKFGYRKIDAAVCHLFVWAYRLRLEMQRVQLATMDNHAFSEGSYLHIIRTALLPDQVISTHLPTYISLNYNKTEELQKAFKMILGDKIFNNE